MLYLLGLLASIADVASCCRCRTHRRWCAPLKGWRISPIDDGYVSERSICDLAWVGRKLTSVSAGLARMCSLQVVWWCCHSELRAIVRIASALFGVYAVIVVICHAMRCCYFVSCCACHSMLASLLFSAVLRLLGSWLSRWWIAGTYVAV